jgi:hypothetical protein
MSRGLGRTQRQILEALEGASESLTIRDLADRVYPASTAPNRGAVRRALPRLIDDGLIVRSDVRRNVPHPRRTFGRLVWRFCHKDSNPDGWCHWCGWGRPLVPYEWTNVHGESVTTLRHEWVDDDLRLASIRVATYALP